MEPAPNDGTSADDERITVLSFVLEEKRYCVDATSVVSVLGIADAAPLADAADPWNAGTIDVSDERVRVVDLPRVFGSAFRTATRVDDPKLVVLDVTDDDGYYYGWLVDDVGDLRPVTTASLEPPHMDTNHVKGRIDIEGATAVWLNERAMHD